MIRVLLIAGLMLISGLVGIVIVKGYEVSVIIGLVFGALVPIVYSYVYLILIDQNNPIALLVVTYIVSMFVILLILFMNDKNPGFWNVFVSVVLNVPLTYLICIFAYPVSKYVILGSKAFED